MTRVQLPEARISQPGMTYGRARLWLGITGVGTMVTLATAGLILGWPAIFTGLFPDSLPGQIIALAVFVLIYSAVQAPLDLLGGYLIPKRFQRKHPTFPTFIRSLLRGALAHGGVLFLIGVALILAGRTAGIWGIVLVAIGATLVLLLLRLPIARATAQLRTTSDTPNAEQFGHTNAALAYLQNNDEGFTGGVVGLFNVRAIVLPDHWIKQLGPEGLDTIVRRRNLAIRSGAWLRGRLAAIAFTWTGIILCILITAPGTVSTAQGVIELSLAFTLWSFMGLLILPTLSRKAVASLDQQLIADGVSPERLADVSQRLDQLQDNEPNRPAFIETIFHPIPNVNSRNRPQSPATTHGCWDVARTSVYLGASGLGLLGRAVHCNSGRPALWVFLPCD